MEIPASPLQVIIELKEEVGTGKRIEEGLPRSPNCWFRIM